MQRNYSTIDLLLGSADRALKTLFPGSSHSQRPSPGSDKLPMASEQAADTAVSIGLMRVNHTGEVCAQALYQGQALTAKDHRTRDAMEHAAAEEIDHLAWCEQRLEELGGRTSLLNPLFYGASWAVGAAAGLAGDQISLGFVAATEQQVCQHIEEHLEKLPPADQRSRDILEQMLSDEAEHANLALQNGGTPFAPPAQRLMTRLSKVMTKTTYYI